MHRLVGLGCWIAGWALAAGGALGQSFPLYDVLFRPPGVHYQALGSPHFEIVFEEGLEDEAREMAAILEAELAEVQSLVGMRRRLRMPVVLNGFNDLANGYVTPFPFRQEIEGVAIKGNRLSPGYTSWLWAVGPHELVHAAHADAGRGLGVGAALRLFAPDVARSFNLLYPRGMTEGVAVFHESRVQPGAGRLNFSLFQMQFRAAMLAEQPWSLAQMLEAPTYDVPFDRFYVGGANVFRLLAADDDGRFFRRMLDLHYRFPFLGQGAELWIGTGTPPWRLGRRLREAGRAEAAAGLAARGPLTTPRALAAVPGRSHRRPRWLDDATVLAYASGLDLRPGFYRFDAATGRRRPISRQAITEDFYFSLSPDGQALHFARYVPDALSPIQATAEVFRLDLATGRATRLTEGGRATAPVEAAAGLLALRNDGPFNEPVQIGPDGVAPSLGAFGRVFFVSLLPQPGTDRLAALANVAGRQGIFRLRGGGLDPWILLDDASILDAAWSRDGRYLLFTADPAGVANVFAYDVAEDRVVRLTNAAFGALEPDLSPDGQTLAYVAYQHEQWDLVTMPFAPEAAPEIPPARWAAPRPTRPAPDREPAAFFEGGTTRPYRAYRHLRPRLAYPTVRYERDAASGADDVDLGLGVGFAVQGTDPLERWAYAAEGFYQEGRPWGRARVDNGRLVLRPFLEVFDLPSTTPARIRRADGERIDTLVVGVEERGATLGLRLPYLFAANVATTRASLTLRTDYEAARIFDAEGRTLRDFEGRLRLRPSGAFLYRIQANPRDLLPNTGAVLSAVASVDAWRAEGAGRRALISQLDVYVPVSLRRHTGLRLRGGLLAQNQGAIFNLDGFVPRGYEDVFFGEGTFATLGAEAVQPLWFVENGLVILPIYLNVFYVYGFGEAIRPLTGPSARVTQGSAGAGAGLQFRFFYLLNFDLRVGAAFRTADDRWVEVFR